jgi:hypothetical protein
MSIREKIVAREAQIAALERAKSSALLNVDGLESERKKLIVPARAGKNKAAQERLAMIDQEIATMRRGIADDEAAIAEIAKELEPLRAQLASEEDKRKREELSVMVQDAIKRALANQRRLQEFMAGIDASIADARSIAACARELRDGPGFPDLVSGLNLNVVAAIRNAHPSIPGTDVPKQVDRFIGALENLANEIGQKEAEVA